MNTTSVTVLTPTYNRREYLRVLWGSLQNQTDKDFEWIIVDDGSTDETGEQIESFKKESDFPIRYIYKENGGKHTALNRGIRIIESALTFIVDSDDWLKDDAIQAIKEVHKKYADDRSLCGYSFLRGFPDGTISGKMFKPNELIGSYIDIRINKNDMRSDKAEVFKTSCLKEFPFPEFDGEHFLGEDIVWARMGRKYSMVHLNKVIYVREYLSGGLTDNRRRNNILSPMGCMYRAKEFMEADINILYRIKSAMQYIIYGRFAKTSVSDLFKNTEYKWLLTVCTVPGLLLFRWWKIKYSRRM